MYGVASAYISETQEHIDEVSIWSTWAYCNFQAPKASILHTPQVNVAVMLLPRMSAQVKEKYGGGGCPIPIYKGFASMDLVKLDGKYLVRVSVSWEHTDCPDPWYSLEYWHQYHIMINNINNGIIITTMTLLSKLYHTQLFPGHLQCIGYILEVI